ncbi:MAG: NAD(P)/FAD-dependent oxidoreductase [Calditrichaeota bacterium]|nr:NAD(P)/FAD-dependent oxidoreductase [Calditrichota bacterium]
MNDIFDVIIVGAGPAGSASALFCARLGLNVCLIEKAKFPRDKICGDAISGKSMTVLKDLNLLNEAKNLPSAMIESITFGNHDHDTVTIPLLGDKRQGLPPGLVIRRMIFDEFLFSHAKKEVNRVLEGFEVHDLLFDGKRVVGVKAVNKDDGSSLSLRANLVFGADGFNSVVARKTGLFDRDPEHWVVALRQYYRNVKGLKGQIELHYIDEVQPGYLWLFPADGNAANVGIGMLYKSLKKRKVDLKKAMTKALQSDFFKERFSSAEPLENPVGWNLPVGSKHRKNFGNGFLLLGDAAGLIDPFTGEGIGNALYSAKIAARVAKEANSVRNFSADFLAKYDRELWNSLGSELKVSAKLQRIGRIRILLNLVIKKAAHSQHAREIISGMMANQIPKTKFADPLFYVKLFLS